jgi:hypothetical protein
MDGWDRDLEVSHTFAFEKLRTKSRVNQCISILVEYILFAILSKILISTLSLFDIFVQLIQLDRP